MNTQNATIDSIDLENELNHVTEADVKEASANTCQVNEQKVCVAFSTVC